MPSPTGAIRAVSITPTVHSLLRMLLPCPRPLEMLFDRIEGQDRTGTEAQP